MGGRDHSCETCGRGGFNDPSGYCQCLTPSRDELLSALKEAVEFAQEGWAYAPSYFRAKWNFMSTEAELLDIAHRADLETLEERQERLEAELVETEAARERKRQEDGP